MEKKEIAQDIKLGIFVLTGVVLFLVSVFYIGSENNVFSRKFTVSAVFKNVEGLKEGDNVWLSGVKVGRVTDVKIMSRGKVVVTLALKNNQSEFIQRDATASIGSDGLVGNKIVVIRPGISSQVISDEDTINTASPADTQELINIAKDVGENTRSLTTDLKILTKRVSDGQGVVGEFLNDGAIAQELRQAILNIKKTGFYTTQASAELQVLLHEMRTGNGLLPKLLADTSYANDFNHAMNNLNQVSVHASTASKNFEEFSLKMNQKNNAIGVLLSDTAVGEKVRTTIDNAEQASRKMDENMEALQHNFLFRGYFRKQEKKRKREAASAKGI